MRTTRMLARWAALAMTVTMAGCSTPPERVTRSERWVVGTPAPPFDPDGPPHPVRHALERLLSRGLTELDSLGRVHPGLAERWEWSTDSSQLMFHLRPGLRFSDGTALTSAAIVEAIESGLSRRDHATRVWLLGAVRGVEDIRTGRPLPEIGVSAPDAHTVRFDLAWPDPRIPEVLALPGVSTPWRSRTAKWGQEVGCGPWRRMSSASSDEWTLVAFDSSAAVPVADTLRVRFAASASRARSLLRNGGVDRLWPVPPDMLGAPLPSGSLIARADASPPRHLLLVPRSDRPPFTRPAARRALVRATSLAEARAMLGPRGGEVRDFPIGAGPPGIERLDPRAVSEESERALGRASFSFDLAYDADGEAAEIARGLQMMWARSGLDAQLRPSRGTQLADRLLRAEGSQALLVVDQPLLPGAGASAAGWVLPIRGPAVGAFRVGWRTREFDLAIRGRSPVNPAVLAERLASELIVIPLARLDWLAVTPPGGSGRFHPRFGPDHAVPRASGGPAGFR